MSTNSEVRANDHIHGTLKELTLSAPLMTWEAGGKPRLILLSKIITFLVLDGFSLKRLIMAH